MLLFQNHHVEILISRHSLQHSYLIIVWLHFLLF
uniref:Uncharacterized protein n=1 Tax=Arundo donax TaxID=35708 RepID=A0A0A9B8X4_ARUDO